MATMEERIRLYAPETYRELREIVLELSPEELIQTIVEEPKILESHAGWAPTYTTLEDVLVLVVTKWYAEKFHIGIPGPRPKTKDK